MASERSSRGKLLAAIALLGLVAVFFFVRSRGTPPSPPAPTVTSAELLKQAVDSFATLRALSFEVTAHPAVPGLQFGAVTKGTGTAIWPDRLVFSGIMQSTPTLSAPVVFAMCGPDRYVELGDGTFIKMATLPNVHGLLFAPDTGLVPGILTQLEQVTPPEVAEVAGLPTWRVTGTVADHWLAKIPGRTKPAASPLTVELWIGQADRRLHQATLHGPMFDGDTATTTRTLEFTRFNESIPLTVPRGSNPCVVSV